MSDIQLEELVFKSVCDYIDETKDILYLMLKERDPSINISHKIIPSFEDHIKYISSRPYKEWWAIYHNDTVVGQVYLTDKFEIGIQILKIHQKKGYGSAAIEAMILRNKCDLFANINPKNEASINLFQKFGFCHIQNTYRRHLTKP